MDDNIIYKNNEWVDINRKVSIKDNYVAGLNLKYNELVDNHELISKIRFLEKIQLKGSSSSINANELIRCLNHLKNLKRIYLNSKRLIEIFKNNFKTEKRIILAR